MSHFDISKESRQLSAEFPSFPYHAHE